MASWHWNVIAGSRFKQGAIYWLAETCVGASLGMAGRTRFSRLLDLFQPISSFIANSPNASILIRDLVLYFNPVPFFFKAQNK